MRTAAVILALCALLVVGCGTLRRQPSRQDLSEVVEAQSEAITSLERKLTELRDEKVQIETTVTQTACTDSTTEETVLTEVFDTSLPVDSLTLTPPLSTRTTVTRVRRTASSADKTEATVSSTQTAVSSELSERADSVGTTSVVATIEEDTQSSPSFGQRLLMWTGVVALAALLLFIIYKVLKGRSGTIKTLISKILKFFKNL